MIIDSREAGTSPNLVAKLQGIPKGAVIIQPLEVGDFWFNMGYVVERKKPNDLLSAIKGDGRFYSQLANMDSYVAKQNPNGRAILIIEGDFRDTWNGMKDRLLLAVAEASVASFYHVGVLYSFDETFTFNILKYWLEKEAGKISHIAERPKRRMETNEERMRYVVEGLPKVGRVSADKLLSSFKSLNGLFSAKYNDLASILGKKAKDIYDLINLEYEEDK